MARGAIAAALYAIFWLVAWCIMLAVGAWVAVNRFFRPIRTIPLAPEAAEAAVRELRNVGINAWVSDRGVVVRADDAELAREWITLTDF